jgi:hypothetical protein
VETRDVAFPVVSPSAERLGLPLTEAAPGTILASGSIMDVFGDGQLRFDNLDVAGRVGRWHALSLTFDARVRDGLLVVRFARALGEPPIVNGIRVTWLGG